MSALLDTNVLSELLRAAPNPAVMAWVIAQPGENLFVTSVTEAEMRLGVRLLPAGKRRQAAAHEVSRSRMMCRFLILPTGAGRRRAMPDAPAQAAGF